MARRFIVGSVYASTASARLWVVRDDLREVFRGMDIDEEREREISASAGEDVVDGELCRASDSAIARGSHHHTLVDAVGIGDVDDKVLHVTDEIVARQAPGRTESLAQGGWGGVSLKCPHPRPAEFRRTLLLPERLSEAGRHRGERQRSPRDA